MPDPLDPSARPAPCRILLFAALLALANSATASEIRAALGGWQYDITGSVDDGGLVYDFEDDLGLESQGEYHLEAEWRTPPGWWPDIVVSWSRAKAHGERFFQGTPPVIPDRRVTADADTSDLDLTLRYPLSWRDFRFAAGLTLKRLASDVRIEDSGQSQPSDEQLSLVFPQAHAAVHWPFSEVVGFSATFQGVKYQDDLAYDARAGLELTLFDPVLVEAGWQQKRYDVTDGDYVLDANLRGLLLRLRWRFPL